MLDVLMLPDLRPVISPAGAPVIMPSVAQMVEYKPQIISSLRRYVILLN